MGLAPATLKRWNGSLAHGAELTLPDIVSFDEPGYYRIQVSAHTTGSNERRSIRRDTAILDLDVELLWILIEEDGGRVTDGFDPTAIDSAQIPLYGSYGPFRSRLPQQAQAPAGIGRPRQNTEPSAQASRQAMGSTSFTYVDGYIEYLNKDAGVQAYVPMPSGRVSATCYGRSETAITYDLFEYVTESVSVSGYFMIQCPEGFEYVEGTVRMNDSYSQVRGRNGAGASTAFAAYVGERVYLHASNDAAAHVFATLWKEVPEVETGFDRSRSPVTVYVAENDPGYGIFYCATSGGECPQSDVILTNDSRVFNEDGYFVSVHEYGHAFQRHAIESPYTYQCSGGEHSWTEQEFVSCAYVEGFADFFAMLFAGDHLFVLPYGGDWGLENNSDNYPSGTSTNSLDGVRVEAAVAAFLYDLVDDGSEPDSPTNSAGSSEGFDPAAYPVSWIGDMMAYCRVDDVSRLRGADELVYCFEGDTTAYAEAFALSGGSWQPASSVSYDQPLASYDAQVIRDLWTYNFYGEL